MESYDYYSPLNYTGPYNSMVYTTASLNCHCLQITNTTAPLTIIMILSLVALLSLSYRYSRNLDLSKSTRQRVINTHAWSIEAIQHVVACMALKHTITLFCAATDINTAAYAVHEDQKEQSSVSRKAVMLACAALAANIFAIYAVDLIEAWIVLHKFEHPYQWRCFVLTRSVLLSSKSSIGSRRRRNRKPALRITIPAKMEQAAEKVQLERPRAASLDGQICARPSLGFCEEKATNKVAYLDLAVSERQRHEIMEQLFLGVTAQALHDLKKLSAELSTMRQEKRTSRIGKEEFAKLRAFFNTTSGAHHSDAE